MVRVGHPDRSNAGTKRDRPDRVPTSGPVLRDIIRKADFVEKYDGCFERKAPRSAVAATLANHLVRLDQLTQVQQNFQAQLPTSGIGRELLDVLTPEGARAIIGAQASDSDLTAIAALATTTFGRSLLTLADAAAGLSALGAQPSDSGLTAIAALTTTTYGRSLLTLADAAAGLTSLGAQPADADLTAIAALTTTSFGRGLLELADAAAALTAIGAQPLDSDLTAIAALTTTSWGRALLELSGTAAAANYLKCPAVLNSESGNPVRSVTSTSYSNLYSWTIPASTFAVGDVLQLRMWGTHKNGSGSTQNMKGQVVLGATTHASGQASVSSDVTYDRPLLVEVDVCFLATGVQHIYFRAMAGENLSTGGRWVTSARDGISYATAAEDETASISFAVQVALGSATDSYYRLHSAKLTRVPT